jgi:transcriptional regulator with XRE-family HTH domain
MIRNERQYRITKSQADLFAQQLRERGAESKKSALHPRIQKAQHDALKSQLDELREELAEYEGLRDGNTNVLELSSIEELPSALIRARIAAGLTQRELAHRLGIKEQQIQRYEATEYAGASLERIRAVMSTLGLRSREEVFLPSMDISHEQVVRRAASVGLGKEFLEKRILSVAQHDAPARNDVTALSAAGILNRIFGWAPATLFGTAPLVIGGPALVGARFKLPQNASTRSTEAYAAYAYYLARLVLRATPALPTTKLSTDAAEVRKAILSRGEMSISTILDYVWSVGIPVLPLSDAGTFHGATWRLSERNVIVLKQGARLESRWIHDLLHEFRHAAEDPGASEFACIDYDTPIDQDHESEAETVASMFAGDVMLAGRAEELAEECAVEARGSIEKLKSVVPRIALREKVSTAALANYMAFRLSLQGQSWWGAATNLQSGGADPWLIARNRALSSLDLSRLDDVERMILLRALEGDTK